MVHEKAVTALAAVGLTDLEAEVYTFLLEEAPATGYRVAQGTGRLPANVYKAIESLQAKGAVIVDEGASRMCRALPAEEFLALQRRRFEEREKRAAAALAELGRPSRDDRVYQLRSAEQVLERCRTMLARASKCVVADVFPGALDALRADLSAAGGRGVQVELKTYAPVEVPGVRVVQNPNSGAILEKYPDEWVILLVDGAELLIGALSHSLKEVRQAVWSGSPTLAYMFHCSVASEILLVTLLAAIHEGEDMAQVNRAVESVYAGTARNPGPESGAVGQLFARWAGLYGSGIPGYEALISASHLSDAGGGKSGNK